MKVIETPFVASVGIEEREERLFLSAEKRLFNHLETLHAGALYTLAESESGRFLQRQFAVLAEDVVPLLRSAEVKYRKTADGSVYASASIEPEHATRFMQRFGKRGRGSVTVTVHLYDEKEELVMEGAFDWYVSQREVTAR